MRGCGARSGVRGGCGVGMELGRGVGVREERRLCEGVLVCRGEVLGFRGGGTGDIAPWLARWPQKAGLAAST